MNWAEVADVVAWAALATAFLALLIAVNTARTHARIVTLERRVVGLPDLREINTLQVKIAALESKQSAILSETHATRASVQRVEDFLLKAHRND